MTDTQTGEDWIEGAEFAAELWGLELYSGSFQIDASDLPEPPQDTDSDAVA